MVSREHVGTRMGLLQQRCTGHLLCAPSLLKAARTLALMLHVLLWEARNLVNLPDKRRFYIFCLWNETAQELQCPDYKHLQVMGISLRLELVRVCVGTCPLLSIFYPMFFAHAKCAEEKEGWKMILIILIIKMSILSGGLGMFLFQSSQWIHPWDFTGGFLALLAQALLRLHILTTTMYLSWAKRTHTHIKAV
ncbi:LOW QUALITY PROTEIN: transmembrane protein 140 [Amazona ochrocephala]